MALLGLAAVALAGIIAYSLLHEDKSGESRTPRTQAASDPQARKTPTNQDALLHPEGPDRTKPSPQPGDQGRNASQPQAGTQRTQPSRPPQAGPTAGQTTPAQAKPGAPVIHVLDPKGVPLAGALVTAQTRSRSLPPQKTDGKGDAYLDLVQWSQEGQVTGTAHHVLYGDSPTFTCGPENLHVEVRFAANGPKGVLEGIVHTAQGAVPPRADLTFQDQNGNQTVVASESFVEWNAGNGRFRLEMAPGAYSATAAAPGFCESDKVYMTIKEGTDPSAAQEFLLTRAGTATGRVTLPTDLMSSRDPIVLNFVTECIRGLATNPTTLSNSYSSQLAPDGSFELDGLVSGQYRMRVCDATRTGAWVKFNLDEGGRADGLVLSLADASNVPPVAGIVRDNNGQPVVGATIKSQLAQATTDSNGYFELKGLDQGPQGVTIEMQGYIKQFVNVDAPGPGSPPPPILNITLLSRGGALGVITSHGQPASGVAVLAVQQVGGAVKTFGPTSTDGTGTWKLDGLDPGDYLLKVGNADPYDGSGTPFHVIAGQTATVGTVEAP